MFLLSDVLGKILVGSAVGTDQLVITVTDAFSAIVALRIAGWL